MSGVTGLVDTLLADRLAVTADAARVLSAATVPAALAAVPVLPVASGVRVADEAGALPHAFLDPRGMAATPGAADQEFSGVARMIASVLGASEQAMPAAEAPLAMSATQAHASSLAPGLAQALARSGLFYESHLAAYVAGLLDREALEAEPQMRWWQAHRDPPADSREPATVAPPLRALIASQLDAFATGVVAWRGEAWPGAPMEWRVADEDRGRFTPGTVADRCWSTVVSVTTPRLGTVSVRLSLAGTSLHAAVQAEADVASRLADAVADLESALAAAGFDAAPIAVTAAGSSS